MNSRRTLISVALAATVAAGGYGAYRLGVQHGGHAGDSAAAPAAADPTSSIAAGEAATRRHITQGLKAGQVDPATGRSILYYHDPMVPGKRFDTPAKSPFMDMMLVPVYGGDSGSQADTGTVAISPRLQQNLGVRTADVVMGTLQPALSAVGSVAWNERDQAVLQARAAGYIEKLHVRATLDPVKRGQPFADLYVPAWVAAQEEYLAVRSIAPDDRALAAAARQRLLLAGMDEGQVAQVEAAGTVQPRTTLRAPGSGVVAELLAREGMTVEPGQLLARINGLASVWVLAELPESQAALVRRGSAVQARSPGLPGAVFHGSVQALLPEVDPTTRTLKARVQLANPGGRLVPGQFVTVQFTPPAAEPMLLVPSEAVIQTGRRAVVMVAEGDGRFTPVDVETGREADGRTEIRRGLTAGQRVVVSGQFLVDSEASLKGLESRLDAAPDAKSSAATDLPRHAAQGRVEALEAGRVTLSHGPIPSVGMGAMTMDFGLPPGSPVPPGLAVGDRVDFEFVVDPAEGPVVQTLRRLPGSGAPR